MNRRKFLITFAIAVPIAVFVPAKIVASWRPVVVGQLDVPHLMVPMTTRVSSRYLVASDALFTTRFDLQDGDKIPLIYGGIAENEAWLATLRAPKYGQLELSLHNGEQTFAYPIPNVTAFSKAGTNANTTAHLLARQTLRIEPNRVELVFLNTYYRWNRNSRKLESSIPLEDITQSISGFIEEKIAAISRDGERVVTLNSKSIDWRSTLSSQVTQRFTFKGYRPSSQTSEQIQVSDYGALALYNVYVGGKNSTQWEVRSTATGRVLWKFALASLSNRAVFSDDEKRLALPTDGLKWKICDAQTGAIIRILPRVPDMRAAAFSPDGTTLYSVADDPRYNVASDILYRQRAR